MSLEIPFSDASLPLQLCAFPILSFFFIHPTECSDELFSLYIALAKTFMNDTASEALMLACQWQPVTPDAI
jgi:hypothetical protein